jgi:hypothetical protein
MKYSKKVVVFPQKDMERMSKKQLAHGRFTADFYINAKFDPPIYHYIITEGDEAEIIAWGQERSMEIAEREAMRCMKDFQSRKIS